MERGNRRLQYFIASAVSSSAVTTGVASMWASPVLPKIALNEINFPITKEEVSWLVSISSIGLIVGSFVGRITSDKCGRRASILGSSLPNGLGIILMIIAWKAWVLSSGRVLWGFGTGMSLSVSAIYIAEISDKDIRGCLSVTQRFMLNFGGFLVSTGGVFVSYQTLNYMLIALPVTCCLLCWWIPESPYYLLKQGEVEATRKTLQMLTGIRDKEILEEKLSQMQSHVKMEMARASSMKELFKGKRYRKAIFITIGLYVPLLMSGSFAIQNYLGLILLDSKSGMNINAAIICFGAIRFIMGITSSMLVDRLGRRPLLIGSFIGTSILLTFNATYFGLQEKYGNSYSLIPFIIIIITKIVSVLGYESITSLIIAEIFPMNVKSIALAMSNMLNGILIFTSTMSYQPTKDWLGLSGVFGTYAFAAFLGTGFCYFFVPETKGKSLREIQVVLNGNVYDEEEKLNKSLVIDKADIPLNSFPPSPTS